ncbi:hypothetical protein [Membranihabitans maritimus]|uniref:hypothetical protein n=1 Tax=Membranihabitans maritimus TaxID=2904244 RepID=UPI001F323C2E|nr:hypothetical protein [Membranihabitans maritimus]
MNSIDERSGTAGVNNNVISDPGLRSMAGYSRETSGERMSSPCAFDKLTGIPLESHPLMRIG